jgi:hypothetical protein
MELRTSNRSSISKTNVSEENLKEENQNEGSKVEDNSALISIATDLKII